MNALSLRSSMSSYRDPRYFSNASVDPGPPPSKVLVDGYRNVLDSNQDGNPRDNLLNPSHPRRSALLHASDPVVIHLLAETALSDSMNMEVLSFEEVEGLKKELSSLSNRIDASKRKLALEMKLQEAAQSLSRLNDTGDRRASSDFSPDGSPKSHRRRLSLQNSQDSELAVSTRKCEELAQELWRLERRASDLRKRLMEHTAGVLQMTHKGLKKKSSTKPSDEVNGDNQSQGADYFDDRSLYRSADHLDDFNGPHGGRALSGGTEQMSVDTNAIQATTTKLEDLNHRLRDMILQARPNEDFDPIPQNSANGTSAGSIMTVQAHLQYLERGLDSIASQQSFATQSTANPDSETENRLEEFNNQLDSILVEAGQRQKYSPHSSTARKNVPQQLSALGTAIEDVETRFEGLIEQKTILTTQIQQQRELNSKSDAERDDHVADLSKQIVELRKELDIAQRDASGTREELSVALDQLEQSDQGEQQRNADDVSRRELLEKEDEIARLEATILELRSEQDNQAAEKEVERLKSENADLESEMVRIQTDLTLVKAELDGAYGSRRERAAEAAASPALHKEMEELSQRNITLTEELASLKAQQNNSGNSDTQQRVQTLEKELRETIDDYESLTKSSIEFEKERDNFESMIDKYRDRCEELETQLSDERIQKLGSGTASGGALPAPANTSTTVLKTEFKKMMRDTRTENMKAIKAEQEERRRLEGLVRSLKKEQAPSKSNLSQSTIAS